MKKPFSTIILSFILTMCSTAEKLPTEFSHFEHGFPKEASFFPIGVWTQNPAHAARYKALGVNYYIGLWQGPTAAQIADLKKNDMMVICSLNEYAEKNLLNEPLVVGWMHGDEPDLAQHYPRNLLKGPDGKKIIKEHWPEIYAELGLDRNEYNGWGMGKHPIKDIQADYKRLKKIDSSRPIQIQLSSAVAKNGVDMGRGDRSGKTWEYPLYLEGSDMASFDIYPVAYGDADKLYQVADGVDSLKKWDSKKQPLMVCIEAGFGDEQMANQDQQRAEIWMAINHGAKGIIWFVHRWQKVNGKNTLVSEKMPLDNPEIGKAVQAINQELTALATVINSPETELATVSGINLDLGARLHEGVSYVFAVERDNKGGQATISLGKSNKLKNGQVEVINEDRLLELKDGSFTDNFAAFGTHLYQISAQ